MKKKVAGKKSASTAALVPGVGVQTVLVPPAHANLKTPSFMAAKPHKSLSQPIKADSVPAATQALFLEDVRSLLRDARRKTYAAANSIMVEPHPLEFIKDPYVLEFLGLPEHPTPGEQKLEDALATRLRDFLMELGKGFSFVARQLRISGISSLDGDYFSLTNMLKAKDSDFFISDWLRNRNTVEFLGIWESVFNPALKINLTLPQHHE